MSLYTEEDYYGPNLSPRNPIRYDSSIIRTVMPHQSELAEPIGLLAENTGHIVDFTAIGKLGMSLMSLNPALRQVGNRNRKGQVSKSDVARFQIELNEACDYTYEVPLEDPEDPLELIGPQEQYLAVRLKKDFQVAGDHRMVRDYILDKYDVSKRFIDNGADDGQAYVVLGEVRQGALDNADRNWFAHSPFSFLQRAIETEQALRQTVYNPEVYDRTPDNTPITFPETIAFGGLRIVCQQQ